VARRENSARGGAGFRWRRGPGAADEHALCRLRLFHETKCFEKYLGPVGVEVLTQSADFPIGSELD
jgi:hypothetical protein